MKRLVKFLLVGIMAISVPSLSFADAGASAKNKCKSGKRYKSKAKVNGPTGCKREKYVDKNCNSATSEAILYRESTENCRCIGSDWTPLGVTGAYAYGHASSSGVQSTSYKTTACRGYKAGGESKFIAEKSSKTEGAVRSELGFSDMIFDYENNSVTLSNFKGLLEINSDDFINEYSIFQISIDVVNEDSNGEDVLTNILFAQATFKDGRLVILGDVFSPSDFNQSQLDNGIQYDLLNDQKVINLGIDIDTAMVLEVTVNTDAGNIMDGNSEIERASVSMLASYNAANSFVLVSLDPTEQLTGTLEIRDLNGVIIHEIKSIQLEDGIQLNIKIPDYVFSNRGNYFIIFLRLSNGQVVTDNILI